MIATVSRDTETQTTPQTATAPVTMATPTLTTTCATPAANWCLPTVLRVRPRKMPLASMSVMYVKMRTICSLKISLIVCLSWNTAQWWKSNPEISKKWMTKASTTVLTVITSTSGVTHTQTKRATTTQATANTVQIGFLGVMNARRVTPASNARKTMF